MTIALLLLFGTILVFLETILIGAIWAIAGVVCYAIAIYLAYADFGTIGALLTGFVSILAGISAFLVWLYVIPKTSFGKKIYLNTTQDGKAPAPDFKLLIGKNATALTTMTPSGKVEVDGLPYDARCESATANAGDKLIVKSANSFELIVRKI
jgi:membrane-bound ClpP family serine protease